MTFAVVYAVLIAVIAVAVQSRHLCAWIFLGLSLAIGGLAATREIWRVPDTKDPESVLWWTILRNGVFAAIGWHLVLVKMLLGEQP